MGKRNKKTEAKPILVFTDEMGFLLEKPFSIPRMSLMVDNDDFDDDSDNLLESIEDTIDELLDLPFFFEEN